jgi:DNA-binding response OmpR family regulator
VTSYAPLDILALRAGLVHMGSAFPLTGYSILVVEDEPLVGLDLADTLRAAGAQVVFAKSASEAISSLDRVQVTASVLDINLGSHDCAAVCQRLRDRDIPFLFHTGYTVPLAGWESVTVIRKPSMAQEIVEAVERLCRSRPQAA